MTLHIGIIGATGIIGRSIASAISSSKIDHRLSLYASEKSQTAEIAIGKINFPVHKISPESFSCLDVVLFATTEEITERLAPHATAHHCKIIDLSPYFRTAPNVPLIVAYINEREIQNHSIVACPNCTTSLIVRVLAPLHQAFELKGFAACTYQSVSGAGARAVQEWKMQLTAPGFENKIFPVPIAHNCIPLIDTMAKNGYTKEELNIEAETKKILKRPKLKISTTCVRISCERCHGIALTAQFRETISPKLIAEELQKFNTEYSLSGAIKTPIECENDPRIYYSRIRLDNFAKNSASMWITGDQIVAGTIPNALKIIEVFSGDQAAF